MDNDEVSKVHEMMKDLSCEDVAGIIMDFAYKKCCKCNVYVDSYLSVMKDRYLCNHCVIFHRICLCRNCHNTYIHKESKHCLSCRDNCERYCFHCVLCPSLLSGS